MTIATSLPEFNQEIADTFMGLNDSLTGLPKFLDMKIIDMQAGTLCAEVEVTENLLTPFGQIHGGVLTALIDHALGCVCYPHMRPGQWAATTEFKLNLLAPVSTGTLSAVANIIAMTKSSAVVRIDVRNEGRLCGAAQGTVVIREPRVKPSL